MDDNKRKKKIREKCFDKVQTNKINYDKALNRYAGQIINYENDIEDIIFASKKMQELSHKLVQSKYVFYLTALGSLDCVLDRFDNSDDESLNDFMNKCLDIRQSIAEKITAIDDTSDVIKEMLFTEPFYMGFEGMDKKYANQVIKMFKLYKKGYDACRNITSKHVVGEYLIYEGYIETKENLFSKKVRSRLRDY